MKRFLKNLSNKTKRELLMRFSAVLVSGVIFEVVAFMSFGWFSSNVVVNSTGMQVSVYCYESYDIIIDRTTYYENDAIYPHASLFKSYLANVEDYDLVNTYSADTELTMAYELINEDVEDGKRHLAPGSYGTMTFYIDTHGTDQTIDFSIDVTGYHLTYSGEDEEPSGFSILSDSLAIDFLKGHFLLFENRESNGIGGFIYDNLITDGTFQIDTNLMTKSTTPGKTDYYEVTLYWSWPLTYDDIVENTSDGENTREYPMALGSYMSDHPEYFFTRTTTGTREELNDWYNDADQRIGERVDFILIHLSGS